MSLCLSSSLNDYVTTHIINFNIDNLGHSHRNHTTTHLHYKQVPILNLKLKSLKINDCLEMCQSTGSIITENGGLQHNHWCDAGPASGDGRPALYHTGH